MDYKLRISSGMPLTASEYKWKNSPHFEWNNGLKENSM